MSALDQLVRLWTERAVMLEQYGAEGQAAAVRRCLADLHAARATDGDVEVGLNEAARLSGYAADSIGRMIREGKIPNYGRKNAPRVRVADLPLRPGHGGVASPARHRLAGSAEGHVNDSIDHHQAA